MFRTRMIALALAVLVGGAVGATTAHAQRRTRDRDKPKDPPRVRRSLVLFPPDDLTNATPPENYNLSEEAFVALSSRFTKIGAIFFSRFNRRHPSLLRAVSEGRLKSSQLDPPYNEEDGKYRRSPEIARELGTELVASGSIAAYSYNGDTRTATITLLLDVVNVADNKAVVSSVATGTATGPEGEKADVTVARALNQAADTVAQDLEKVLSGKAPVKKDAAKPDAK